ncbi:MAG: hypothetical protein QOF49_570, partial [Chloroflexota bacterium]|nr:hypothetical protein [Chloroflexota bacterium]
MTDEPASGAGDEPVTERTEAAPTGTTAADGATPGDAAPPARGDLVD